MTPDADRCYAALRSRDRRFDGVFFVGVATTGIYCRPICPARLPAKERCVFFDSAAAAERAGFRACFRCRPELAPGAASVDARSWLVRSAATRIEAGFLNEHSVEDLAAQLGVSARHLRRVVEAELGVAPQELAQTRRLALAKQLLHDTALPLVDLAFAAGFSSVRRFNDAFRARFGQTPSAFRKSGAVAPSHGTIELRLEYRAPFDFERLLAFLAPRTLAGVELVGGDVYRRTVRLGPHEGLVVVSRDVARDALRASLSLSLAPRLMELVARLRALFDLDARPADISAHLGQDAALAPLLAQAPGLRVPGAFDGFEVSVRAILGQQISVRGATTLAARLVERFGVPAREPLPGLACHFPRASELAALEPSELRTIGLPLARAQTIISLARAVAEGGLELARHAEPQSTVAALCRIRGIGPWTAHYVAMRALGWPDAFPSGDLILLRRMGVESPKAAERLAEAWRPWRAYAVLHQWSRAPAGERGESVSGSNRDERGEPVSGSNGDAGGEPTSGSRPSGSAAPRR